MVEGNETSEFKETSVVEKTLSTTTSESCPKLVDRTLGSGGSKETSGATKNRSIQETSNSRDTSRNEKDLVQKDGDNKVTHISPLNLEELKKDSEDRSSSVDAGNSTKSKIPVFIGKTHKKDNGTHKELDVGHGNTTANRDNNGKLHGKKESRIDSKTACEKKDKVFPDVMLKRESSITMASTYGISEIVSATRAAKRLKARRQASKQEHKESILI